MQTKQVEVYQLLEAGAAADLPEIERAEGTRLTPRAQWVVMGRREPPRVITGHCEPCAPQRPIVDVFN
jgi:hypothetical protein